MKYHVGDIVKIKPRKWYKKYKDEYGWVECDNGCFFYPKMEKYCGTEMTIKSIGYEFYHFYEMVEDNGCNEWTTKMIECKIEDDGKEKFERTN